MKFSARTAAAVLIASFAAAPIASHAAWPDKPIRVILPWAPGGSTDVIARLMAAELTKRLKQQVVIDNRPGGGGIVGMQIAANQPADGYTFMSTSTAYGYLIYKSSPPVDLVKSFAPVSLFGLGDSALAVNPNVPVKSVKELIELAKAKPGSLNYSSSGIGGFPHMNAELFKLMTGTNIVHVPFQGAGPAVTDVVGGQTQMHLGSLSSLIMQIKAGRLRALGVGGKKPSPELPGVPTISQTVPGFETYIWWGLFTTKATSPEVIARVHGEVQQILDSPDIIKKMELQGANAEKMSTADFGKLMDSEQTKWLKVIKSANIKAD
jgi:tripartite-type tricarboxylate transporter receptor subunit TctC